MSEAALEDALREALVAARAVEGGQVASYIPELARAAPEALGLAVCTVDGQVSSLGDDRAAFTLQSISKPLTYALALACHGTERVRELVSVEPSGDSFDSVIRLADRSNRPHNPMVNAGAIAVTSLLCRPDQADGGLAELLGSLAALAGRERLDVDTAVYLSERDTGHRNRAIAHLLRHFSLLSEDLDRTLELYFQQCSVLVDCRDLAVIAGTLANGGTNPITGRRVLPAEVVSEVLSVMASCGLYGGSGEFFFRCGLPAKSGVAGGLLAVAPGRMGLAAWAPPLDRNGTTLRGARALEVLSQRLGLHLLEPRPAAGLPDLGRVLTEVRARVEEQAAAAPATGAVASYVPQLAAADPAAFALATCDVLGVEHAAGQADEPFTIQSAANPFCYALALADRGAAEVHRGVGLEPSGNPFNAVVFDPVTRLPYNPLVNAGAIAVCGLIRGANATERIRRLLELMARCAGVERLHVDVPVYLSERAVGDRNRAIASLLRNFAVLEDEEAAWDLFLQQCSVRVSCRLLARMAATLANGGRNPLSGEQCLPAEVARQVTSVMFTCGMNDASGRFAVEAGLPAKSGVSGGVFAVAPGRLGLAAWSPAVDGQGNSWRGARAVAELARRAGLGLLGAAAASPAG